MHSEQGDQRDDSTNDVDTGTDQANSDDSQTDRRLQRNTKKLSLAGTSQTLSDKPRAFAPKKRYTKSKHGCRTCKVRKIRCDETYPLCRNCTKTNRPCDGVTKPTSKVNGLQFAAPLTLTHFRPSPIRSALAGEDLTFFDLFRNQIIYSIVGEEASRRPRWKSLILQAVHEEPALCHAAIAFSALSSAANKSRARCSDEGGRAVAGRIVPGDQFALKHYGKCIASLKGVFERDDGRSVNVALLCSLLCMAFELRMEDPYLAVYHLEHGLRVVEANVSSVEPEIIGAFQRMDLQATTYLGARPPVLDIEPKTITPGPAGTLYEEADSGMTTLMTRVFKFIRNKSDDYRYRDEEGVPLHIIAESHVIKAQLNHFHDIYLSEDRQQSQGQGGRISAPQLALLRVNYLMGVMFMETCLYAEESMYDRFMPDFITILDLSTDILKRRQAPSDNFAERAVFSLDMGIVYPVYITALKCRSSRIRHRAIALLAQIPGSEGIFEGPMSVHVASRVVAIEEEGLGLDDEIWRDTDIPSVPEFRRVHSTNIDIFYAERRAIITYQRRSNGMDGGWDELEENMAW